MAAALVATLTGGSSSLKLDPKDLVDYVTDDGEIIRMHHQRRSPFSKLPIEITSRIGTHLTTEDLGSLRLTCKQIESCLFREFAKEFFSAKQFMVTYDSLDVLLQISKHKNLGPRLNRLIIGLDNYNEHETRRFRQEEDAVSYNTGYGLQHCLLEEGDARDVLAAAIKNLPNLQLIEIRDQNSHKRTRDNKDWRSYGWRKVEQDTGLQLTMNLDRNFVSQVFQLVVSAIAKADQQVPEIEVILKNKNAGLIDRSFIIAPTRNQEAQKALAGFTKLHLDVNLHKTNVFRQFDIDLAAGNECVFLKQFLKHTSNLTQLRLNFQRSDRRVCHFFLEWMIQNQMYKQGLFPNLEQLELGFLSVDVSMLIKLAKAFPKLSKIGFYRVTAVDSQLPAANRNLWALLIKELAEIGGLKGVNFGLLQQCRSDLSGRLFNEPIRVGFLKHSVNGSGGANGDSQSDTATTDNASKPQDSYRNIKGDGVSASLKALAKDTIVNWPKEQVSDDDDEDIDQDDPDEVDDNEDDEDEDSAED